MTPTAMGFRFRKSFKLPGGFRINLSTKGIGASAGVRGFRVGVGPSGSRMSVGIPGTGVGWTGSLGGSSRPERAARTRQRQLQAAQRDAARMIEREQAAYEVAAFENYVDLLMSLHKESWSTWDWNAILRTPPPQPPAPAQNRERQAFQAYQAYVPGFADKLWGADQTKRQELAAAIEEARRGDVADYHSAIAAYQAEYQRWQWFQNVARGVVAGDVNACQAVLQYLGPFNELQELGSSLNVAMDQPWCVEAWFAARSSEIVPREQLSLTTTGKVSRKKMPQSRYWEIYQDHVCSAALRIAREVFALLPIPVVFVHAGIPTVNRQTGNSEHMAVLSVAFDRETLSKLNLDMIDPSDSLQNFEHAMTFKKSSGFAQVEPLTPAEFQITE